MIRTFTTNKKETTKKDAQTEDDTFDQYDHYDRSRKGTNVDGGMYVYIV